MITTQAFKGTQKNEALPGITDMVNTTESMNKSKVGPLTPELYIKLITSRILLDMVKIATLDFKLPLNLEL